MAWHPRWQLATKGKVYLAGPGFMLVVPEEADVVLKYGHTSVGVAGMVATLLSLLVLVVLIWRDWRNWRGKVAVSNVSTAAWPKEWLAVSWPVLLVAGGLWFHLHNPERIYTDAWTLMRANQYSDAAVKFDDAFAARRSEAKKEEALFWSAKAYEQAGKHAEALQRYRQLNTSYHGYWLPESLYTQAKLDRAAGNVSQADSAAQRLIREFPNDNWAKLQMKEAKP
jgi:tetratricopeptide (TPR) repeat protein